MQTYVRKASLLSPLFSNFLFLLLFNISMFSFYIMILLLLLTDPTGGHYPDGPFQLVNRSAWGAVKPKHETLYPKPPPKFAVIIHTATLECTNLDMCCSEVRSIQRDQMRIFDDIAYNFLVGGDGRTYEGRGWDAQGAFARQFNNDSFGIAFIGYYYYYYYYYMYPQYLGLGLV